MEPGPEPSGRQAGPGRAVGSACLKATDLLIGGALSPSSWLLVLRHPRTAADSTHEQGQFLALIS